MKRIILFSAIALLLSAMGSCEKEEKAKRVEIKDKLGIVSYNEEIEEWVIVSSMGANSYDSRILFIPCKETPIPSKYKQENIRVIFSGNTSKCSLNKNIVMPAGTSYKCLKILFIKLKK